MGYEPALNRYRYWYARLLRLYPRPFRNRFSEGMQQTFSDLLRERARKKQELLGFALWVSIETGTLIFKEHVRFMSSQNKRVLGLVAVVGSILLIPLIAMQFTDEVNWTGGDFIFAGVLLLGTGLGFEWALRKTGNAAYRAGAGVALLTALLLVWVNGAVGIIGNENNPANLLYLGVLAIGFLGVLIARFRPRGMARALYVTALAQVLVPVVAFFIWAPAGTSWGNPGVIGVFMLSAFFAVLFAGSAALFKRASIATALVEMR